MVTISTESAAEIRRLLELYAAGEPIKTNTDLAKCRAGIASLDTKPNPADLVKAWGALTCWAAKF